jgi:tetratricopeptide (TPR) repeat protein
MAGATPQILDALKQRAATSPTDATAQLDLGIALQAAGDLARASASYRRCVEVRPAHIEGWCRLALVAQQLGQLEQSADAFSRALELNPTFAEAACNLGGVLLALGRAPEAAQRFKQALVAKPDFAEALNGLAIAQKNQNLLSEAASSLRQALALRADYSEAWYNLGNTLLAMENWPESIAAYEKACSLGSATPELLNNLGLAFWRNGNFAAARELHEQAVRLKPDYADACNNLGNDLLALHRHSEAANAFERAFALNPKFREALCNLGNVYLAQNTVDAALDAYRRASSDTEFPEASYNEALALLLKGDLPAGFRRYESRWNAASAGLRPRSFPAPRWQGEPLAGRTILLHSEQGIGDTLQFVRYAPLLAESGANVILSVQAPLKNFLARMPGIRAVVTANDPQPHFDFHCPLLSLPLVLGTTIQTIPANVPYLVVPQESAQAFEKHLDFAHGPKIGLVCSGNPRHRNDHNRSIPLAGFIPIAAALKNPVFMLQKDFKPADAAALKECAAFVDLSPELHDFASTAAVISQLDLVISVDTSVAHLAGALGKPVWVLLPFAPDWRWLLDRSDSPWYPTMTLLRQRQPGDWQPVLEDVRRRLASFAQEPSSHQRLHNAR